MVLEEVCTFEWTYDRGGERVPPGFVVLTPFGEDGAGYGEGRGTVDGRIAGDCVWSNHPRRRGDGRMLPDVHGLVTTRDGARIVFAFTGRTVFDGDIGSQRLIGTFETDVDRYRWLNDLVCIAAGEIRPGANTIEIHVYAPAA